MKSQIIVAYAAQTRRRLKRPQMRLSKPVLLTLWFEKSVIWQQKIKKQLCVYRGRGKPELLDLLHERLLWVVRLHCSHSALCMCGLLGSFSSLRWSVQWCRTRLCSWPSGRPLTCGADATVWASQCLLPVIFLEYRKHLDCTRLTTCFQWAIWL